MTQNKYPNLTVNASWVNDSPGKIINIELSGTVVAITGHRPDKLGNDYTFTSPLVSKIRTRLMAFIVSQKPDYMMSGMALGIDTLWAMLAIENNIPLIAAIPFDTQDAAWPNQSRNLYQSLLKQAHMVVNVSGQSGYMKQYMQLRNEWMVDNCTKLIAVWDGSPGGTANCIRYAQKTLQPNQIQLISLDKKLYDLVK